MDRIITGSRAFFDGMEGFRPHDTDVVVLVNREDVSYLFKSHRFDFWTREDIIYVVRNPKERYIRWAAKHAVPMSIAQFLTPDFANEFGITIDDLPLLQPMRDHLDNRHQYLGMIYDFYLQNGSFSLTEEQRQLAYNEYKRVRTRGL